MQTNTRAINSATIGDAAAAVQSTPVQNKPDRGYPYKDDKVLARSDGGESVTAEGIAAGSVSPCRMEGCRGLRIAVRWADGKLTRPCSRGLLQLSQGIYQIQ